MALTTLSGILNSIILTYTKCLDRCFTPPFSAASGRIGTATEGYTNERREKQPNGLCLYKKIKTFSPIQLSVYIFCEIATVPSFLALSKQHVQSA